MQSTSADTHLTLWKDRVLQILCEVAELVRAEAVVKLVHKFKVGEVGPQLGVLH